LETKVLARHTSRVVTPASFFGVVYAVFFKDFSGYGYRGVYWVADDGNHGIRAELGTSLNKCLNNGCICVKEIITSHSRFTRYTCGDDYNISPLQSLLQPLIRPHRPLHRTRQPSQRTALRWDMAQIRSHAGSTDDIITAQFVDLRREFAEEREGLADPAGGSEDGYLGVCGGGGVDGAGGGAEGCDCFGGEAVEHHG
jgi:hypothetical protein